MPDQPSSHRAHADWAFVAAAFVSQLASAYYDIVRGPLMPSVAGELHLGFTESSWFLATSCVVATISTLLLIGALNRWSERTVMLVICTAGIAAGALAPAVHGLPGLLLLGSGLGLTISTVGTMANVLLVEGAPTRHAGRFLSGLHSMYGIGSMAAAQAVGWALARGVHWASVYAAAVPVYVGLLVFAAAKLRRRDPGLPRTVQTGRLTPVQALVVVTFAAYAAGEVTFSLWLTSYLVKERSFTVSQATPYLTGYFLVFTLARIACAFWIRPRIERFVLYAALLGALAAYAVGYYGATPAFMLVGLYGPVFPVLLARVSRRYPAKWRAMTIWVIVALQVSVGVGNVALGGLADLQGMRVGFLMPPALVVLALVLVSTYFIVENDC